MIWNARPMPRANRPRQSSRLGRRNPGTAQHEARSSAPVLCRWIVSSVPSPPAGPPIQIHDLAATSQEPRRPGYRPHQPPSASARPGAPPGCVAPPSRRTAGRGHHRPRMAVGFARNEPCDWGRRPPAQVVVVHGGRVSWDQRQCVDHIQGPRRLGQGQGTVSGQPVHSWPGRGSRRRRLAAGQRELSASPGPAVTRRLRSEGAQSRAARHASASLRFRPAKFQNPCSPPRAIRYQRGWPGFSQAIARHWHSNKKIANGRLSTPAAPLSCASTKLVTVIEQATRQPSSGRPPPGTGVIAAGDRPPPPQATSPQSARGPAAAGFWSQAVYGRHALPRPRL